ncbi:MAG: hypothetical protein ABIP45_04430 [Knoellia sp.]
MDLRLGRHSVSGARFATALRRPHLGLVLVMLWWAAWFLGQALHGGASWHFFVTGATVLSDLDDGSQGGLHVYAEHPVLQIGPLALGIAWALARLSAGHGQQAAELLGSGLGVVVVLLVRRIAQQALGVRDNAAAHALDRRVLLASVVFAPIWLYAAVGLTHLDDVLALAFGIAALALVQSRHTVWAGLAVAVAVDSKPWALPFAMVLLALPSIRMRAVALTVAGMGVLVAWLPFFLVDPQTVQAMHFTIANSPRSGLRFLGVSSPRTPPWDRPLQTILGLGLAAAAVWRGRAAGIPLVVMASRLALDPSTNRYYTAGLVAGALLWDLVGSRRKWPWWSLTVLFALHIPRWVPALDRVHGLALVSFALVAAACVIVGKVRPVDIPPLVGGGVR